MTSKRKKGILNIQVLCHVNLVLVPAVTQTRVIQKALQEKEQEQDPGMCLCVDGGAADLNDL